MYYCVIIVDLGRGCYEIAHILGNVLIIQLTVNNTTLK